METVGGFCCLGDRLNSSGGCEAAVTARVRSRFPMMMKNSLLLLRKISDTVWKQNMGFKKNEKAIIRQTERAMVRARSESFIQKDD